MIVPLIITASGTFFFFARLDLVATFWGLVLAHTILGLPFVVITVTATLVGFDTNLTKAAASLGGGPIRNFFKVQMPLILPGVISGALFAFITSFDEVIFWSYVPFWQEGAFDGNAISQAQPFMSVMGMAL